MRLVSRSELARHLGLSRMAVTQACKERIAAACVGNRVDLDHPSVQAWMRKHGKEPPAPADEPAPRGAIVAGASPRSPQDPRPAPQGIEDIKHFEDLTLAEMVAQSGSMSLHSDWLDMRRKQVQIRERELKNLELEGKLIVREAVRTHVFGAIDHAFRRLLNDAPKTLARRIYAMAASGEPVDLAEALVRDTVTSLLKPVKDTAARTLRAPSSAQIDQAHDARAGTTAPVSALPPPARTRKKR